jgi:hypothetical protein
MATKAKTAEIAKNTTLLSLILVLSSFFSLFYRNCESSSNKELLTCESIDYFISKY